MDIFLLYGTSFFFEIFLFEIDVVKYTKNYGEVKVWWSGIVSKLEYKD